MFSFIYLCDIKMTQYNNARSFYLEYHSQSVVLLFSDAD